MAESFNSLIDALEKKRDCLNEIRILSEKQLVAAKNSEWAEFNRLGESIDKLTQEIDEINFNAKTEFACLKTIEDVERLWDKEKTAKIKLLKQEMQVLTEESLQMQEQSKIPISQAKEQALKELQVLELRQDAAKAYGWPNSYMRSVPRFIDKEK
ncbi:MAG TPA: hypothetical protein GX522_10040 [Firmicutes bacterium]|jgi:hypothetical protein|nr:hypothetical protein [Bacillota bacterium]